jgi:hypothetical protein
MKRVIPLVLLLTAACGSATVTNPSSATAPINLAGNWIGTTTNNVAGTGAVDATISQSGPALSGSWSVRYQNAAFNIGGPLTGSLLANTLTLTLASSSATSCSYNATATFGNGPGTLTISGTYTSVNCAAAQNGTFNLSR